MTEKSFLLQGQIEHLNINNSHFLSRSGENSTQLLGYDKKFKPPPPPTVAQIWGEEQQQNGQIKGMAKQKMRNAKIWVCK